MSLKRGKTIQNKLIQHMLNMSHSLITQFTQHIFLSSTWLSSLLCNFVLQILCLTLYVRWESHSKTYSNTSVNWAQKHRAKWYIWIDTDAPEIKIYPTFLDRIMKKNELRITWGTYNRLLFGTHSSQILYTLTTLLYALQIH